MKKYIDAEKLIERLEEMKRAEYENCGGVNSKTGALQEVQELIDSLQQEQPDVECEEEINKFFENVGMPVYWCNDAEQREFCSNLARHFYELGLNARKED